MTLHFVYLYDNNASITPRKQKAMQKMLIQTKCLEMNGMDVNLHPIPIGTTSIKSYISSWCFAYKMMNGIASKCKEDDIIFSRSCLPYFINTVLLLKDHPYKFVCELHGIEKDEFGNIISNGITQKIKTRYLIFADRFFGKYIKSHSNGLVSVTNEITEYNRKVTQNMNNYLTLGNGIDIPSIKLKALPKYDRTELHVLCLSTVNYWHGLDRFINGMANYNGQKKIRLHIVGHGSKLPDLKVLTSNLHLESHVIYHGYKTGADLDDMFDQCHIAIDALAGFRKNLNELSTLKAREYCARGIPFLMASKDADFPENWEYIQMVPADESPIDMNTVISFAERVMADHDHPQKMRKYAEEHLAWLAKMKVLKEFLETL